MQKPAFFTALSVMLLMIAGIVVPVAAQELPKYQGYVNDYAGLLSEQRRAGLETQLVKLQQDTTAEVAVVTINSLEGSTIEEYAVRLFENWGIGKKEQDNGVLFIVAKQERKVRIEVGYGLEPVITDGRAGRILDNEVLPMFKAGDYEAGIENGVKAIESFIRDGTPPSPAEENPLNSTFGDFSTVLMILLFVSVYLTGFMARTKTIWLGTIWGLVAGGVLGFIVGGLAAIIIMPLISTGLGAGLDYVLSKNYRNLKSSGKPTSWQSTWGGFGGSGRSGGFGGFGGGGSGGGGASRGW